VLDEPPNPDPSPSPNPSPNPDPDPDPNPSPNPNKVMDEAPLLALLARLSAAGKLGDADSPLRKAVAARQG